MLKLVTGQQPIMMPVKKLALCSEKERRLMDTQKLLLKKESTSTTFSIWRLWSLSILFFLHQLICFCYIHNYISEQVIGLAFSSLTKHIGTSWILKEFVHPGY